MTDPDDDAISRRYREHAREQPPAALDEAILAASRRAVHAGPRGNRWAVPASIAAVLVLGIGVSLRMQMEQPGIETSTPGATAPSEYSLPAAAPEAAPSVAQAPAAADASGEKLQPLAKDAAKPLARSAPPAAARKPIKPADLPPEAVTAAPATVATAPAAAATAPATPAPAPFSDLAASSAAPPPAAASAPAPQPRELRARREAASEGTLQKTERDERDRELERIARLRAEGRHDEADKALEAFRRTHPQYRIPEAVWEKVRPR